MQIAKQLALFLENRPGTLARLCKTLAAAQINIHAISTMDSVDHHVVRLVLSNTQDALRIFEEHGSLVVESEVLMIDSDNQPGSLGTIAEKLAGANINVEYAYTATRPDARKSLVIMRVSNARKALKVLNITSNSRRGHPRRKR